MHHISYVGFAVSRWALQRDTAPYSASRPLLYLHLRRLEEAGLVHGTLALSDDGKALKQYVVTDWAFRITPETISDVADSIEPSQPSDDSK